MSHSVIGDRWMFIRRRSWEQQSAKVCYQHFECDSRKFCDWIYCSDKRFVMKNFVAVLDWMTCQVLCEDELRLIQSRRNLASHRPLHKPHWTGLFTRTTYRPTGFKQADSVSKSTAYARHHVAFFWPISNDRCRAQRKTFCSSSLIRVSIYYSDPLSIKWNHWSCWFDDFRGWSTEVWNSPLNSKNKKRLGIKETINVPFETLKEVLQYVDAPKSFLKYFVKIPLSQQSQIPLRPIASRRKKLMTNYPWPITKVTSRKSECRSS